MINLGYYNSFNPTYQHVSDTISHIIDIKIGVAVRWRRPPSIELVWFECATIRLYWNCDACLFIRTKHSQKDISVRYWLTSYCSIDYITITVATMEAEQTETPVNTIRRRDRSLHERGSILLAVAVAKRFSVFIVGWACVQVYLNRVKFVDCIRSPSLEMESAAVFGSH